MDDRHTRVRLLHTVSDLVHDEFVMPHEGHDAVDLRLSRRSCDTFLRTEAPDVEERCSGDIECPTRSDVHFASDLEDIDHHLIEGVGLIRVDTRDKSRGVEGVERGVEGCHRGINGCRQGLIALVDDVINGVEASATLFDVLGFVIATRDHDKSQEREDKSMDRLHAYIFFRMM